MKILYHHRIAALDGGEAVHIAELISALRGLGHEVITIGHVDMEAERPTGGPRVIDAVPRGLPKFLREPLELGYSLLAYHRLRQACLTHKPDILYERANLFLLAGAWIKRKFGLPYLLEVNAPLYQERNSHGGIALKRLARWSEETAWRAADYVLPVSNVLADRIRSAGVPEAQIVVVPNAVNLERFSAPLDGAEAKKRLGLEGRTVLGFAGYLRVWHRLDRVLDLLERDDDNNLHFLVIGDGLGLSALRRQVQLRGVSEHVTFLGSQPRDDMAGLISAFDIALLPGVTAYASPLKTYEYMALGRAIVAPDTPNIREILSHGETALLFDPDSTTAFGQAIGRLCHDPALRNMLGTSARATIVDQGLTWENTARRVVALAKRLTESSRPGSDRIVE
jgi:glycosyltransferase involved in cell wall biosynthesis